MVKAQPSIALLARVVGVVNAATPRRARARARGRALFSALPVLGTQRQFCFFFPRFVETRREDGIP